MSNSTSPTVSNDDAATESIVDLVEMVRDQSAPPGMIGLAVVGIAGNLLALSSALSMFQYGLVGASVGTLVIGVATGHTVSMVGLATLKSWAVPTGLFFQAGFVGLNALAGNVLGVLLAATMFVYILSDRDSYRSGGSRPDNRAGRAAE